MPEHARQVTESALAHDSDVMPLSAVQDWLAERRRAHCYEVERISLNELRGWRTVPDTGNMVHDSGRFFAIEGLRVVTDAHPGGGWSQPIINQPEVGILGMVARPIGGVLHFLMQAKMEPGNVNSVQLSPTVQATRSNYTGTHGGRTVPYLSYLVGPHRVPVLADVLQSEQCSWFLRKRNRNVVALMEETIPVFDDFCWLSLGQIRRLLNEPNLVNMDARTVLACLPFEPPDLSGSTFQRQLLRSMRTDSFALHSMLEVVSWLTEIRTRRRFVQTSIPLRAVDCWVRDDTMRHVDDRYFEVVGVDVRATGREVAGWTQPLFAPLSQGLIAFIVRPIEDVLHILVRAHTGAGAGAIAELGPTVQCNPANYVDWPEEFRPRFLDVVLNMPPSATRYDVVQSEEGGRFYRAETRNVIVEVDDHFPVEVPEDYLWINMSQLTTLLAHSNYVNIEARSLVACLQTLW
jgi:oxidase EvaA